MWLCSWNKALCWARNKNQFPLWSTQYRDGVLDEIFRWLIILLVNLADWLILGRILVEIYNNIMWHISQHNCTYFILKMNMKWNLGVDQILSCVTGTSREPVSIRCGKYLHMDKKLVTKSTKKRKKDEYTKTKVNNGQRGHILPTKKVCIPQITLFLQTKSCMSVVNSKKPEDTDVHWKRFVL